MDFQDIITAISTVGFPIVACCVMFNQNNKLQGIISDIKVVMQEMTDELKHIESEVSDDKGN